MLVLKDELQLLQVLELELDDELEIDELGQVELELVEDEQVELFELQDSGSLGSLNEPLGKIVSTEV